MPYKFETDKLKIPREHNKRIKLTDEERKEIKQLYGKISQRKLAKKFDVSRRLITFIGDTEKAERSKIQRKLNGILNDHYYKKDRQKAYMKKHRHHKQELSLKGQLIKTKQTDNQKIYK
jgi:hypothetical protein